MPGIRFFAFDVAVPDPLCHIGRAAFVMDMTERSQGM
jgi:hypothetical protein